MMLGWALIRGRWPLLVGILLVGLGATAPTHAWARKPEKVLGGRIIVSTKAFPTRFKSDAAFVRHMRKVDTKTIRYGDKEKRSVELMAFFRRVPGVSQLTATLYDITERREMKATFPIYTTDRETRILASGFVLDKETYPVNRKYHLVITVEYGGRVLAETQFVVK